MQDYTSLIVDGCPETRLVMNQILRTIPEIAHINETDNIVDAWHIVLQTNPDIVFLDIEMPGINGFEIKQKLSQQEIPATIIFLASDQNHMLDAIRANAFDYILKPIEPDEIRNAIKRFQHRRTEHNFRALCHLMRKYHHPSRIKINTKTGFMIIDTQDIVYLMADGTYTEIFLSNGKVLTSSLNLGKLVDKLPHSDFVRISRSSCVNLKYVKAVNRIKRICILEKEEDSVELSISRQYMRSIDEIFA